MSEAKRILAHIEAGHTEVYPLCDECRQSKDGVESLASGHGAVLVGHTQPHQDGGGARMDAPIHSLSHHESDILT